MRNSGNRNLLIGLGLATAGFAVVAAMNRRRETAVPDVDMGDSDTELAGTTHLSVTVVHRPRAKILVFPENLSLAGLDADVTLHWTIDDNLAGWTFAVPPIRWKNPGPAANAFGPFVMVNNREFTVLAKNPRDNKKYRYDLTLISPTGEIVSRDPSVENRPRPPAFLHRIIIEEVLEFIDRLRRHFLFRP